MLTLLKVDAKDLPVPTAYPKAEMVIGQWALALGRTLDPEVAHLPSMSPGIISATGRIMGKMTQTDAKVSPVNYGGPLVHLDGRVFGILVPASLRGESDTAGVEWYDSGIGFAVPLEDVFAVLPRLKNGTDLRRGILGVIPKEPNELYNVAFTVGQVSPDSAALKAGIKEGDKIVAIDGKPIPHYSALQHALGPKYEGDAVTVTVKRGDEEVEFKDVQLTGAVTGYTQPFLGVLPMRDDPDPGAELRYVFPDGPAGKAGLKDGDRVMKVAPVIPGAKKEPPLAPVTGRAQLANFLRGAPQNAEVKLEVKRKDGGKTETIAVRLGVPPAELLPEVLPLPSSAKRALERPKGGAPAPKKGPEPKKEEKPEEKKDDKKDEPETGLQRKTNPTLGREYWVYVPENYDKNVSHGVIVWFHAANRGGKDADDMVKIWRDYCQDHHFIVMGPKSKNAEGWLASETEEVVQDVNTVLGQYTVDRSRVIAHGMGVGGQMAMYVGFNARDLIRGVAVTGSVLGTQPKDTVPGQPLSFFIVAGAKDPLLKDIQEGKAKLDEKKFPVVYREIADFGKEYLDEKSFQELRLWMDSLDRL
jgi:S1-C subfamily serine protease/predicted esterase